MKSTGRYRNLLIALKQCSLNSALHLSTGLGQFRQDYKNNKNWKKKKKKKHWFSVRIFKKK